MLPVRASFVGWIFVSITTSTRKRRLLYEKAIDFLQLCVAQSVSRVRVTTATSLGHRQKGKGDVHDPLGIP